MALTIFIKDLVVSGKHGVHPHEKETPQPFKITAELELTDERAAASDNLTDTADWSELKAVIVDTVTNNSYDLVEHLAHEIAARLLAADERIAAATITIDKMEAFESGVPGVRLNVARTA